jgi:peroxiredoxin Q/BCP
MHLSTGDQALAFSTTDILGNVVTLADYRGKKTLICFFRYVGCPFCQLVFQAILAQYPKFAKKGLAIVVFFQSPKESIIEAMQGTAVPFPVIADPEKELYNLYGVESSVLGAVRGLVKIPTFYRRLQKEHIRTGKLEGDLLLMPAYFLVGPPEFTVHKARYSADFTGQMPFVDIEDFLLFE